MPGLTPMVQRIMIACGVIWVAQMFFGRGFTEYGAVSTFYFFERGFLWQPFTYMWLHEPGSPFHLLFNMFALWMFGGTMEQLWGSRRFLRFYLICGVGAGFIILFWNLVMGNAYPTLGASGAIYGLLTAFSLTFPDRTIMLLFPPIPMKAIWFIPVLFVLQFAMTGGASNVSHIGHLGGVIVAGILMRREARRFFNLPSLRYRWHRYRMRGKLRAVRKEEWERQKRDRERFH